MKAIFAIFVGIGLLGVIPVIGAPQPNLRGHTDRPLRYRPDGSDFVIHNGDRLFNRPLYGTPNVFRIDAGDRPQFALYQNAKLGVLRLGIITELGEHWLDECQSITARYRPGAMDYEIRDAILPQGSLTLTVIPRADAAGLIVKIMSNGKTPITLVWCYGGVSVQRLERGGDLIGGNDLADLYRLRPDDCRDNLAVLHDSSFTLTGKPGTIFGIASIGATVKISDAAQTASPQTLIASQPGNSPMVVGQIALSSGKPTYLGFEKITLDKTPTVADLASAFDAAEKHRRTIAERITVDTPDPYLNASVGAFCVAGDAIWGAPNYLHGANAWRSALLGWRGPYVADVFGWHDRAQAHFSYWASKQNTDITDIPTVAKPDPKKNLAENDGAMLKSYGAIPAGHYDMAMVYIDELFRHYFWTGDMAYVRQTWPVIKRHLEWEKRCFDRDGLYEAYCAIWASDAMQYNGGGTTHASAYNAYHFALAARIAKLMGEDPTPYAQEAARIHAAMDRELWMPKLGWYGEYKDILGLKLLHPAAAVYTIYHTIDSQVSNPFQSYQMLRYVDTQIPTIPIQRNFAVLSTSNWLPYQWSLNNVVFAEVAHTALAQWQAGQSDAAWRLYKGNLLDAMYLGACPGDVPNLSQFDANRGESYRDFGDAIGMGARTLIEGLFGILPDALSGQIVIRPGFPKAWDHASIRTPDIAYSFRRQGQTDTYEVTPAFGRPMRLRLQISARFDQIASVTVNNHPTLWHNDNTAIGTPGIEIETSTEKSYSVVIHWQGEKIAQTVTPAIVAHDASFKTTFGAAQLLDVYDPQTALRGITKSAHALTSTAVGESGHRTAFAKVHQGDLTWWLPIDFEIRSPYEIVTASHQDADHLRFRLQNNTPNKIDSDVMLQIDGRTDHAHITALAYHISKEVVLPSTDLLPGSSSVTVTLGNGLVASGQVVNWSIHAPKSHWETIDLTATFNDTVTQIFKNEYLSPRSPYCSLQIPIHGIGSWSSPNAMANIDDSGLRKSAGELDQVTLPNGIPFRTPSTDNTKNIAFTSQWDNYPCETSVALTGRASHAYFLMAGSTGPMQSRLDNGEVIVTYADNTVVRLALNNPTTWWPIEQDYITDDYAFQRIGSIPPRILLKTGDSYFPTGTNKMASDGGAATVLDLPLDSHRTLKSVTVRTLANDVVIGLMSVTLVRP